MFLSPFEIWTQRIIVILWIVLPIYFLGWWSIVFWVGMSFLDGVIYSWKLTRMGRGSVMFGNGHGKNKS
jgi:hypothetical protein